MSSQSFERVVEYDKAVTGGNLSDVMGMERLVAFLARDPDDLSASKRSNHPRKMLTLT